MSTAIEHIEAQWIAPVDAVLQSVSVGFAVQDRRGRFVYANMAAARILGYSDPPTLVQVHPRELAQTLDPRDETGAPLPAEQLPSAVAFRGERCSGVLIGFRTHDKGEHRWAVVEATPVLADDQAVVYVVTALRDVTAVRRITGQLRRAKAELEQRVQERTLELEAANHALEAEIAVRRRVEASLRTSEERFRGLIEMAPDAMVSVDRAGKIVLVNAQTERLFGYGRAELLGQPIERLIPDRYRGAHARKREAYTGAPHVRPMGTELELIGLRKDGSEVAVEVSLAPTGSGRDSLVTAAIRDVTERKAMEEQRRAVAASDAELERRRQQEIALAAEKDRLAVTLRSIGDGVIATDVRGAVTLINPVAERMTGFSQAEAEGRLVDEILNLVDQHTGARAESPVHKVLADGLPTTLPGHLALVDRHGAKRLVADSASPIRDATDTIVGSVLVFRDVTDQERIDAELRRASKLESLGVLAGGIAHDFNNLLTGILANVSLARLTGDAKRLADAERATLRTRELTQQLLTFAKGGVPIRKPTSVRSVVREATIFALSGSNVRCELHLATDLWACDVDPGQIAQVLQNLVLNAQQAMPHGGKVTVTGQNVTLGASGGVPLPPGRYVRISVQDEGPGIPEALISQVFDPFFTTKQTGSGLGLATAYAITKKHDGHLAVESPNGRGATFTLTLPATSAPVPVESPEEDPGRGEGRILIMDDEPIMRETVTEVLRALGYQSSAASSGEEALRMYADSLAAGHRYDAVILDLTVAGGMGGKETIRKLLELDPLVRAVVSSGYSEDPVMARYREYGFRGVVAKPYTVAELRAVLRNVLDPSAPTRSSR